MKRKLIGRKHFGGLIDITDPCYDRDVWCRSTAIVKDGLYDCIVWETDSSQVGIIGIYLNGNMPAQRDMKPITTIGVDAGLAGFFINKPDYDDEEWKIFCNRLQDGDAWIIDEGFFSTSGDGDGLYDVFANKQKGEIAALEIRFM